MMWRTSSLKQSKLFSRALPDLRELTVKEQELADTAVDVATRYRLLFASVSPAEDGLTMEVVLPDVKTDFMTNLKKTRPVSASQISRNYSTLSLKSPQIQTRPLTIWSSSMKRLSV
jgi:hypothetical protein